MKLTTGQMIKKLRKAHGWTQEQLAERCGVSSFNTVQLWEHDRCLPAGDNLFRLARALDIPMETLIGGEDV